MKEKTLHGGVSEKIIYLTVDDKPATKETAVKVVIQEFDEQGTLIYETCGTITR